MFVYIIYNTINSKSYVGITTQPISHRMSRHRSGGSPKCRALTSAIKKYGVDNFVYAQIDCAETLEELKKKEESYIKLYNTISPNGYNLTTGGEAFKMHESSKLLIGEANRRRVWKESSKKKLSESRKGTCLRKSPVSDEERRFSSEKAKKQWAEGSIGKALREKAGRKIFVIELNMQFNCASDFCDFVGEGNPRTVSDCLTKGRKFLKKYTIIDPTWSEEKKQEFIDFCNISQYEKTMSKQGRPVIEENSGIVYSSLSDAGRSLGICHQSISSAIRKRNGIYKDKKFTLLKAKPSKDLS